MRTSFQAVRIWAASHRSVILKSFQRTNVRCCHSGHCVVTFQRAAVDEEPRKRTVSVMLNLVVISVVDSYTNVMSLFNNLMRLDLLSSAVLSGDFNWWIIWSWILCFNRYYCLACLFLKSTRFRRCLSLIRTKLSSFTSWASNVNLERGWQWLSF